MNTAFEFEAQAAEWLVRREAPDFTTPQMAEFEAWANADPRHRAAFVRLEAAWRRADGLSRLRPLDGPVNEDLLATSPFARLEEHAASDVTRESRVAANAELDEGGLEERPPEVSAPPRRWLLSVAVAAAVALVAIGAVWFFSGSPGWHKYTTEYGSVERIPLEDGSVVHLNTNSVMRVQFTSGHRQVVLERGEALFKVAHDVHRPFDVKAAGTIVRAVGTEFSVRVREAAEIRSGGKDKDVEVLVKEGRVAIDPPKRELERAAILPSSTSTLSAGETVTITATRLHVEKIAEIDVSNKLSWTEGRLWFERQRLADVVAEFNRYNRRQMVIADPSIADLRIGGGFEATDPESFIAALERTLGVRAFPSPSDGSETDVIRLVGTRDPQ